MDTKKGFTFNYEAVESLILDKALHQFSENRSNDVVDRMIAVHMQGKIREVIDNAESDM